MKVSGKLHSAENRRESTKNRLVDSRIYDENYKRDGPAQVVFVFFLHMQKDTS